MSVASTFATALATAIAERSAIPPPVAWTGSELLTVTITSDGGCIMDRSATLTAAQALDLGTWLVSNFT